MPDILKWMLDNWTMLLVIVLFLGVIIFLIISFAIAEKKTKSFKEELNEQNNSVRVYIIDMPNNSVRFFNAIDLGNVRTIDLSSFYRQFPITEQRKVIDWIKAVLDPEAKAPNHLEADVTITKTRKQYFSLLQVDHVDYERGVLHVQSFLLKYLSLNKQGKGSKTRQLSTISDYNDAVNASKGKRKGLTACYTFRYKKASDRDRPIDRIIIDHLKNALSPLLEGKRIILSPSDNEIVICDTAVYERQKASYMLRQGISLISTYLSVNGYLSKIDVRVGAVWHRDSSENPEEILEKARNTAKYAFDTKEVVFFYEKGRDTMPVLADSSYRSEIERIINDKKLSFYFRPIYSVKDEKVVGYFTKAEPFDTYFETMDDIKNYASRSGDAEALFSTIFRRTLPLFLSERERPDQLLFFPARMDDISFMLRVVARSPKAKDAHLVFLFSESDLRAHIDFNNPEAFLEDLTLIKAKGYAVALYIDANELGLPTVVYPGFDHFACSFALPASSMEMDTRVRMQLHALPERLLKYEKPIIAADVENWNAIDIIVHSKLTLFSADVIGKYTEMIEPIGPKTLKKLKDISR